MVHFIQHEGTLISEISEKEGKLLYSRVEIESMGYVLFRRLNLYEISYNDLLKKKFRGGKKISSPKNTLSYFFDEYRKWYVAISYDDKEELYSVHFKKTRKGKCKKFFEYENDKKVFSLVGFKDENTVYVLSNRNTDKVVLHEYAFADDVLSQPIYSNENYDLIDAAINSTGELRSVSYYRHGVYTTGNINANASTVIHSLSSKFEGKTINIVDGSRVHNKYILSVASENDPGEFFLYDAVTEQHELISPIFPMLQRYDLMKSDTILVDLMGENNETIQIEAYLTKPKARWAGDRHELAYTYRFLRQILDLDVQGSPEVIKEETDILNTTQDLQYVLEYD